MTAKNVAIVVGGGIAGLTAAAALGRANWQVTVVERASAFGEVGAGLAVTHNGMAALDVVGAAARVRALGHPVFVAGVQDRYGRWLMRVPRKDSSSSPSSWVCGIHRQQLHAVLLQAAEGAELITGASALTVRPGDPAGERAALSWRDQEGEHHRETDLVVAADGIGSIVRTHLFPESRPVHSGKTCWRAVIEDRGGVDDSFVITYGPHTEFGALRISDDHVYWYGYFSRPAGVPFDDELVAAREHFADWSPQVRDIVAATTRSHLIRHDVHHLRDSPPTYVRGRVVCIGDAAHAMLPTMGQGANTSIEDGACVGRSIGEPVAAGADLGGSLGAYDHARRARCRRIARRSVMADRFGAEVGDGWPQVARNTIVRLTPAGVAARAGAGILRWTPPAPHHGQATIRG